MAFIHQLAREGLSKLGHHGPMTSMGVPRHQLPHWDEIQIMAAQMATKPLMEDQDVATELVIGPEAKKSLRLSIPLMVSDMSFGALSEEAKISLSRGAELVGIATQKPELRKKLNIGKTFSSAGELLQCERRADAGYGTRLRP